MIYVPKSVTVVVMTMFAIPNLENTMSKENKNRCPRSDQDAQNKMRME